MDKIINWQKHHSVGIERVDIHHRRILEILQDLQHAVQQGIDEAVLWRVFGELDLLIRNHFDMERSLFECVAPSESLDEYYARTDTWYGERIFALRARYASGENVDTTEIVRFLCKWWMSHILEDKKIFDETAELKVA